MTSTVEHDIRYSEIKDDKYLYKWLNIPSVNEWFSVQTEEEIKILVRNWIGYSRYRSSLTATINDIPCAIGTLFLMPYKKIAHHCYFYLAVDPTYQKKGVGTSIVKNLLNLSKNYFRHEFIYADIFEGCPLEIILKKFDFAKYLEQEGYIFEEGTYKKRLSYQLFF